MLSKTGGRDKLMALVQFVPCFASGPVGALGASDTAERLMAISSLADKYRTVTRLTGLLEILSPVSLARLAREKDATLAKLGVLETGALAAFFASEMLATLSSVGIIKPSKKRAAQYGPLAVFFWFYQLTLNIVSISYRLFVVNPRGAKERYELQLNLVKSCSWWIFALSLFSKDSKPQLQEVKGGLLAIPHTIIETLSPSGITLSAPTRGLLGTVAMCCDLSL